jgi:hypothetical protein
LNHLQNFAATLRGIPGLPFPVIEFPSASEADLIGPLVDREDAAELTVAAAEGEMEHPE